VDAQVSSLANAFLVRTKDDIRRLRKLLDRAGNGDRMVLKESERIAHSIHGAGAVFGFPHLSEAAGAIERLVGEITAAPAAQRSPSAQAVLQILGSTQELAQALETAVRAAAALQHDHIELSAH
jgi:HPt (histidine-containing phosphotransfer) domain-containing protein